MLKAVDEENERNILSTDNKKVVPRPHLQRNLGTVGRNKVISSSDWSVSTRLSSDWSVSTILSSDWSTLQGGRNKTYKWLRRFMIYGNPVLYCTYVVIYASQVYFKFLI